MLKKLTLSKATLLSYTTRGAGVYEGTFSGSCGGEPFCTQGCGTYNTKTTCDVSTLSCQSNGCSAPSCQPTG